MHAKPNHRIVIISVCFSSTWWSVMMIIRKASDISTKNYIEPTFTSLQFSKKHFHKNNNTLHYERHCTRLHSFTIDSPQNYLRRMMKCGIHLYIHYAQTILEPRHKNNANIYCSSFEQKLLYYKLVNKSRLQLMFTRIINIVTCSFERTSRFLSINPLQKKTKKRQESNK